MTVGIASICHRHDEPRVLVTADRMVTFGQQAGIEYEDTEPKIFPLVESDDVTAVAVGSGVTTYIDEILRTTRLNLESGDTMTPGTMQDILSFCLTSYQQTVKDTINNQVMNPLGYSLDDLKNPEVDVPPEIQKVVAERSYNLREQTHEAAQILVAGVGNIGPKIYQITGMDFTDFTDMGYAIIGSGSDSARLTFIRRRYDRFCEYAEGVFTILDSKSQAEERQGVGQIMDLVTLAQDESYRFDEGEKERLRQKLKRIEDEERNARRKVMDGWEPKGP